MCTSSLAISSARLRLRTSTGESVGSARSNAARSGEGSIVRIESLSFPTVNESSLIFSTFSSSSTNSMNFDVPMMSTRSR